MYAPDAIVRHRHPERLGVYLWRKLRFGYYRARLYGRYPARMREDGYTPRTMPVQIAVAGAMLASAATSPWCRAARPVLSACALAFLGASLPTVARP